jgi:hypothetical protein
MLLRQHVEPAYERVHHFTAFVVARVNDYPSKPQFSLGSLSATLFPCISSGASCSPTPPVLDTPLSTLYLLRYHGNHHQHTAATATTAATTTTVTAATTSTAGTLSTVRTLCSSRQRTRVSAPKTRSTTFLWLPGSLWPYVSVHS